MGTDKLPQNDELDIAFGEIDTDPAKTMKVAVTSDELGTAFGEIDTDPAKTMNVAVTPDELVSASTTGVVSGAIGSSRDDLFNTLVNVPLVISADPVEDVDDEWARAQIGKMSDRERVVLKARIEEALRERRVRGLVEVVDIVSDCMPDGVRKPVLCDEDSSRVVQVVEADVNDPEMVIDFHIMGMPNKIVIEENSVRIYVSFGPKFILYAK